MLSLWGGGVTMILAAGLTPAWQQILVFDGLRLGEVNRALEAHWCASGKVANVALALHHLGAPARAVIMEGGEPGKRIEEEFAAAGIGARWIRSASPTRVCTTVIDAANGRITELVENARPALVEEIDEFTRSYEEEAAGASLVVLSGSLPPGAPMSFYRDLLERTTCRAVLDVRGAELLEALKLRPFLVKPNREELGATFGRNLHSETDLRAAMTEIRRLGAEWVVVSDGSAALWAAGESGFLRIEPPQVRAVNTIGCGDCLAAGLAWGLQQGMDCPDAICLGVAAAAENALTLLPCVLDPDRVRERSEAIRARIQSLA